MFRLCIVICTGPYFMGYKCKFINSTVTLNILEEPFFFFYMGTSEETSSEILLAQGVNVLFLFFYV